MTTAYYIETEKMKKHNADIVHSLDERKYVILFEDSGRWQWASAEDPGDKNEGWAFGLFADGGDEKEERLNKIDRQFMMKKGKRFEVD